MNCNKCGAEISPGAAFCVNCGEPVSAPQAAPQPPVTPQPQAVPQPQVTPAPQAVQYAVPAPVLPGKGMGIAAMVLGIVSLALFCIWYISIPCAIVGAVLGGLSASKAKEVGAKNGMATAGLVCSIIAIGLAILFVILVAIGVASMGAFL